MDPKGNQPEADQFFCDQREAAKGIVRVFHTVAFQHKDRTFSIGAEVQFTDDAGLMQLLHSCSFHFEVGLNCSAVTPEASCSIARVFNVILLPTIREDRDLFFEAAVATACA